METINSYDSWKTVLGEEKQKPYFKKIMEYVEGIRQKKTVYPSRINVFNAFKLTPFDDVKVVILGQDPYHGPNQAHGLCFSVLPPTPPPPSLENIFKELHRDLGLPIPHHGCLEKWAKQGVLLLNATLTVEAGKPQSHVEIWKPFTDRVMTVLNDHGQALVFLLWGAEAQRKGQAIDPTKHTIFKAPHPSPLSAHRGFLGCGHFSKTNAILKHMGKQQIDWTI